MGLIFKAYRNLAFCFVRLISRLEIEDSIRNGLKWCWRTRTSDYGWGDVEGLEPFPIDAAELLWGAMECGKAGVEDGMPSSSKVAPSLRHLREQASGLPEAWTSNRSHEFKGYLWMTLSLLKAGEDQGSEAVQRLLKRFRPFKTRDGWSYDVGGETYAYNTIQAMMCLHLCDIGEKDVEAAKKWLLSAQNKDGGWGWFKGHLSNNLCTAWAVIGLKDVDEENLKATENAKNWLISQQQNLKGYEGRWLITPEPAQPALLPNALYVHFSSPYALGSLVTTGEKVSSKHVQSGLRYLLSLQDPSGGWPFERGFYWFKCPMSPITWATGAALWALGTVLKRL